MNKALAGVCFAVFHFFCFAVNQAQGQAVGNGTIIPLSAGERESYGLNALESQSSETSQAVGGFATRHHKLGQDTGIGGSFIGTTSPTSESAPAALRPVDRTAVQQFHLPPLGSAFSTQANPALRITSPALPAASNLSGISSQLGIGAQTSSIGVEDLPSFSQRESAISKMEFSKYGLDDWKK